MIVLTRLNGSRFGINDEQIERLEDGPNAVVVLVNGNRYTALESLDEIVDAIVDYRARVLNAASITDIAIAQREPSISLFRSHSILGEDEGAQEVDDESPIPGRRPSVLGTFRGLKPKKD
jgi:flagellar protein FlbD